MGVSNNNGTPKSSILIGFSIINHPFWGTPIFGNIHIINYHQKYCFQENPTTIGCIYRDADVYVFQPKNRIHPWQVLKVKATPNWKRSNYAFVRERAQAYMCPVSWITLDSDSLSWIRMGSGLSINQTWFQTVQGGRAAGGFLQCNYFFLFLAFGLLLLGDIPGGILCGKTHHFWWSLRWGKFCLNLR